MPPGGPSVCGGPSSWVGQACAPGTDIHPAQLNLQAQVATEPRKGSQSQGALSPDALATGTKDGGGGCLPKARTDWAQRGGVLWADQKS